MTRREERRAGWYLAKEHREGDRHYVPDDGYSVLGPRTRDMNTDGRHARSPSRNADRSRRSRSRSPLYRECKRYRTREDDRDSPVARSRNHKTHDRHKQNWTSKIDNDEELQKRRARAERFGTPPDEDMNLWELKPNKSGHSHDRRRRDSFNGDTEGIHVRGRASGSNSKYHDQVDFEHSNQYSKHERLPYDRQTRRSGRAIGLDDHRSRGNHNDIQYGTRSGGRERQQERENIEYASRYSSRSRSASPEYHTTHREQKHRTSKSFMTGEGSAQKTPLEARRTSHDFHPDREARLRGYHNDGRTKSRSRSFGSPSWDDLDEDGQEIRKTKGYDAEKLNQKVDSMYGAVSSKRGFVGRLVQSHHHEDHHSESVETNTGCQEHAEDFVRTSSTPTRKPVNFKIKAKAAKDSEHTRASRGSTLMTPFFPDASKLLVADDSHSAVAGFADDRTLKVITDPFTIKSKEQTANMSTRKLPFDLSTCARPNILALQPYRCARDDYKDDGTNILLDANENAYGPGLDLSHDGKLNGHQSTAGDADIDLLGLNRYPDPHQFELKQQLCSLRNTHVHTTKTLTPENLFVGVGSDEAIDALLRAFCRPGSEKILTCPPTYGMYKVSAAVNDVSIVPVPLTPNEFQLNPQAINEVLSNDSRIKLVYICSPGNPTAALIKKEDIRKVLEHPTWNGVVVVDEAYIDFAPEGSSLAEWVTEWPNLVVMQTLSKAFGLAGIRLGAAFTSPEIARLLNSLKAPYNVSNPTSQLAQAALQPKNLAVKSENVRKLLAQRDRLVSELPQVPGIGNFLGGFEANFLLVEFLDAPNGKPSNEVALQIYETLAEKRGVVVRFRGKEFGCTGCLRITVGTEEECTRFLKELKSVLQDIYAGSQTGLSAQAEEKKEVAANEVIA